METSIKSIFNQPTAEGPMNIVSWNLARLLLLALVLAPAVSMAGFSIQNGQLVDNNGMPFVMRGINYPYTWFQSQPTQQDFAAMSATGANTVRIVLSTGGQWARVAGTQVSQLIQWAKDNRMIAVLEVHDSTGWREQTTAVPISNAVAYWTSADIRAAIDGQENFVIINIANEPFGNTTTANYVPDTTAAIQALRAAGLTHTIMIDGATWGQDWSNTMRDNAMQLWNADSRRNLLFSVHMYEVYQTPAPIIAYMQAFDDMALPLVIGEFGPQNNGQPVDVETVFSQAQQRSNGYLGWSWSGNGGCCVTLDMVQNFSPTFTAWGNRIVNGTNGIRTTSVRATVFPNVGNSLVVSTTTLTFGSVASSSPVAVTTNVGWTVADDQSWLSVAPTTGASNGSFTVSATANTGTTNRSGTVTVSGGGITRQIVVTQPGPMSNNLTIAPTALSLGSATSSASIAVTANTSWTVTDDQSWLSVSSTSGVNNGTLTVSASANTSTASRSGTVTISGGGISRTIAVAQAGEASPTGSVTATGVVTNSSGWFTEEQLRLSNTANLTALSIIITVQRTTGVSASGQYNTIGGTISQSNSSTATAITYVFALGSGQSLTLGTNRTFAVQMGGNGAAHPSTGDTYSVTGIAGGQPFTLTGTF
jgi:mannan endo-1,4-beta-mannosidase